MALRIAPLVLSCLFALACVSAGPGDRRAIRTKGDYVHPGAGITLPAKLGPLERKLIDELNGDENDLVAYYASENPEAPVQAHVYVGPAGQAYTGRLKQQFVQRLADLRRGRRGRSPQQTRVLLAPGGTGRAVGYEAAYQSGIGEAVTRTLLRVFQCGQWFFRIQASVLEKNAPLLGLAVDEFHGAISCEAMADHSPAGETLERSLEPGVAGRAEWVAYADGQVEWLRRNVSPGRLALGIPDHELPLFVAAWKRALDARRAQAAPVPDPLFDALERARQAGFLEEYAWTEHLAFLSAPIELDLEGFRAWKSDEGISAAYQIRAGAVLTRAKN
jgi:hypothetical protein